MIGNQRCPIIFVAHSLGGLIVKDVRRRSDPYPVHPYLFFRQALDYSDRHHNDLTSILLATRGIVFLGTTHRGNGTGSFAKSVASVVQAIQGVKDNVVGAAERDSQMLDRLRNWFSQNLDKGEFMIFSFVEEVPMPDGKKVRVVYIEDCESKIERYIRSWTGNREYLMILVKHGIRFVQTMLIW